MQQVIKENEISTTNVLQFTEASLVRPGERLSGVSIWRAVILPPFSGAQTQPKVNIEKTLLIEVDDPDDAQTADRVRTALFEKQRR